MSFIENLRDVMARRLDGGYAPQHLSEQKRARGHASRQDIPAALSTPNWANGLVGVRSERRDIYNAGLENRYAVKSLRTGENYIVPAGENGSGKYQELEGGIGGARYLGNSLGDVYHSAYFSDKDVSDKIKPKTFKVSDPNRYLGGSSKWGQLPIGEFTVLYDDDGAIAGIDIDWDTDTLYGKDKGREYKGGQKIRGATRIAQFFSDLGTASDSADMYVSLADKETGDDKSGYIKIGGSEDSQGWIPTRIFGSKGIFSDSKANEYDDSWKAWNETGFGTERGSGKKAWDEYWSAGR